MPDTDGVQVRLGADTGQATSGVTDAASSIASSLKGIQDALQSFGTKNKQVLDDAVKNNANLSRSFLELKGSVTGGFNAIAGVVERFRGVLGTLTAALAGGALFKESVSDMLHMEDQVRTLEIALGATAERATQLSIALKLAGSDADTFAAMAFRVQMRLNTQSDEFDRLGVKVKDAAGNFLPMEDILQNIYTRMQDFKAGADQNGFALEMVGRQARDFANEMSRLGAVQQRATELQKQLGIEMGPEKQAQIEGYRIEFNAFKVTLDAMADRIGSAVLPGLLQLADYFNNIGPSAIEAIVIAVKGLLTAFDLLKSLGVSIITAVAAGFLNLLTIVKGVGSALYAGLTGQWGKIPGIVSNTYGEMKAQTVGAANAIVGTWQSSAQRIAKLWGDIPNTPRSTANLPKSGNQHFTPKPQAGSEDDSLMAGLENELKAEQDAYNKRQLMQGSFQTWSIEQTRDYWKNVLDQVELSTNDRMAAENKYYDAERAVQIQAFQAHIAMLKADEAAHKYNIQAKIADAEIEYQDTLQRYGKENAATQEAYRHLLELRQQLADQRKKIADIEEKQQEATSQHELDMKRLDLQQQVALREVSTEQSLAIERSFLDQEYAQLIDARQKRIDAMKGDPNSDPVALAQLEAQLLRIRQDYETKATQLVQRAELERKQASIDASNAVQNSFSTLLQDLTNRTKTVKQAFLDFFNSINQSLTKIASDQIAKQLFGAGTTGGNFLNNLFGKIFGGGASNGGATPGINPKGGTINDALNSASGGGQAAATQAATASLTQLSTAATSDTTALTTMSTTATTTNTAFDLLNTITTTLQAAFETLQAAAQSAASALASVGGGGLGGMGGGGGAVSLDSFNVGDNFAGGIPFYATGTNYVPRNQLAFIHQGEAIVPAAVNQAGRYSPSGGMTVHNHFIVQGAIDQRSQGQVAAAAARGVAVAQRRHT